MNVKQYAGITLAASCVIGLLSGAMPAKAREDANVSSELHAIASGWNAKLPVMLSNSMRLDKVQAGHGDLFTYYLTIVWFNSVQLKDDRVRTAMKNFLMQAECSNSGMRHVFKLGVPVKFVFSGDDGKMAFSTVVTAANCGIPALTSQSSGREPANAGSSR